jgi:hypothetical protein
VRRLINLAVTIAAALFDVVAAPVLAQNSEAAPAAAALMKFKPKTPAGGAVTVKVTNWRDADLVELQVVKSARLTGRKCWAR